jgi:hypothetical protein
LTPCIRSSTHLGTLGSTAKACQNSQASTSTSTAARGQPFSTARDGQRTRFPKRWARIPKLGMPFGSQYWCCGAYQEY